MSFNTWQLVWLILYFCVHLWLVTTTRGSVPDKVGSRELETPVIIHVTIIPVHYCFLPWSECACKRACVRESVWESENERNRDGGVEKWEDRKYDACLPFPNIQFSQFLKVCCFVLFSFFTRLTPTTSRSDVWTCVVSKVLKAYNYIHVFLLSLICKKKYPGYSQRRQTV